MTQPTHNNERGGLNDRRELAYRRSGGISVRLCWRPRADEVFVEVSDQLTGEGFVLEPPKADALSAFYHPYALKHARDIETIEVKGDMRCTQD